MTIVCEELHFHTCLFPLNIADASCAVCSPLCCVRSISGQGPEVLGETVGEGEHGAHVRGEVVLAIVANAHVIHSHSAHAVLDCFPCQQFTQQWNNALFVELSLGRG